MATILMLDDDKYFRTLTKNALEARGHTVLEAERCVEADNVILSSWVDLALVDGLLPDGMGMDWIQRLRQRDPKIAIVFCSSFFKDDKLPQGIQLAAAVRKPIAPLVLAAKIENALRAVGLTATPQPRPVLDDVSKSLVQELPTLLTGVRKAVAQLRSDKRNSALRGVARRRAHQLASSAGAIGENTLGEACAEIEAGIVDDDWKKIDVALDLIRHDLRAVA